MRRSLRSSIVRRRWRRLLWGCSRPVPKGSRHREGRSRWHRSCSCWRGGSSSLAKQAAGRKQLEAYLESAEKSSVRYAGDYVMYVRKQQLERVAGEYARAGLWADAMSTLGRFLDTPSYSGGDPPVDNTLLRVLARIGSSPVQDQYKTLHAWTMPEKDRQAVRILTSPGARVSVPSIFWRPAAGSPGPSGAGAGKAGGLASPHGLGASTAQALIEAAQGRERWNSLRQKPARPRSSRPTRRSRMPRRFIFWSSWRAAGVTG